MNLLITFYFYFQTIFYKIKNYLFPFNIIYTTNNEIINCSLKYNLIYWFMYIPIINNFIFNLCYLKNICNIRFEYNNQYHICKNKQFEIYNFFKTIKHNEPKLNNFIIVYITNIFDNSVISLSNINKYYDIDNNILDILYFELLLKNIPNSKFKNYKISIKTSKGIKNIELF